MRIKPSPRRLLTDTDGAALIEAALVLPILLTLLFALADLSLYFWDMSLVRKAVQLGVRTAVTSNAVAIGPGLTPAESATYWFGAVLGARCTERAGGGSACPSFAVTCGKAECTCEGSCRFGFSEANLAPILSSMRAVLPRLDPTHLRVSYATNGLGFVGRPAPVPVNVTIQIADLPHETLFLGLLFDRNLLLSATATMPSEDLSTP